MVIIERFSAWTEELMVIYSISYIVVSFKFSVDKSVTF